MKEQPIGVDPHMLHSFDFQAVGRALRSEDAYEKTSKNARTLVLGPEFTMVLVAMKSAAILKEHRSGGPATAIVIEGEVVVSCPERVQRFGLAPGQALVFSHQTVHEVRAIRDSLLLLLFGQRVKSDK